MDIKLGIKFDELPFPDEKDEKAVDRYIKAFEDEFGEDYRLSDWIDPSNDWEEDEDGKLGAIDYEPRVEKLERIKRRRELKRRYKKAKKENDLELIESYDMLRNEFDKKDDGWNHTAYLKTRRKGR